MDKCTIRQVYKELRKNITNREDKEEKIYQKAFLAVRNEESVFCYESFGTEVSTKKLIKSLEEIMSVYVPEVCGDEMKLLCRKSNTYASKPCAVSIVPLIAFDKTMNRIGYGGGYYDRYLLNNTTRTIGLAFDEQKCDVFKKDVFDIPLDMIITPTKVFEIL